RKTTRQTYPVTAPVDNSVCSTAPGGSDCHAWAPGQRSCARAGVAGGCDGTGTDPGERCGVRACVGRAGSTGTDVSVWWARPAQATAAHLDLLNPAELARREALRQAADRDRFTVAAALLRLVTGQLTGLPPERVPVERTCDRCGRPHGRPRITGY